MTHLQFIRVKSKYNYKSMKILTSILLLALFCYASSQVIGIDLGTQFWKASLISPGKNLVIVENSRSGRKSYNGIAFMDGIRHFQYDAFTKRQKKPKASYFYLNKLIESLDAATPLQGYRYENGTYFFTEAEDTISLQQLVGMILKNIKTYSSAQAGSDIRDSVFTVPAHWGFRARQALVNAAAIADLSVLGLINENSAAAIHFAITRNDTDAVNIGFFNLGSDVLQISIIQFFGTFDAVKEKYIESMRVLSHISVPNIGGLSIDEQLASYIADEFQAKHKVDVRTNEKSWVKLLHKCSDVKETLSANKQANIYIQGFINGLDLNMIVKRQVLQKSPLFRQLNERLQEAVDKAGLTKEDVQSVQIIGGASRIPLVGKIVKEFFDPIEVGSHINGDESMAFGAALRAANLSIAFRVKQLHFYDGHPEQVRAVVTNIEDGVLSEISLYDKDSEHGLRKQVTVEENQADIKVAIYYGEEIVQQYLVTNISQWKDKFDETKFNFTQKPKVVLVFTAHSINFAELKEAYVNITLNTTTTKEVIELVVENVTIQNDATSENDTAQSDASQSKTEEQKQEETAEKNNQNSEAEGQKSEQTNEKVQTQSTAQKESNKKTRQRTKNVKKLVEQFKIQNKKHFAKIHHQFAKYRKYSKEETEKLREVIHRYQKHENYIKERAKIRNDFQSTLYRLKDDYDNEALKTFSTETELQKLKDTVTNELVWLEDNAWTAEKADFQTHFRTVQRILNPIVNRSNQYNERESVYNKTIEVLSLVYSKTAQLNASQPWVQEKAQAHLKKVNQTVQYIHSRLKKQTDRKLNQDVIFYNQEMINRAEDLRDQYYLIKMIPRPKVTKKVETPKEPTTDQTVDLDGDETKQEQNNQEESTQQTGSDSQTQQQQEKEETKQEETTKEDL